MKLHRWMWTLVTILPVATLVILLPALLLAQQGTPTVTIISPKPKTVLYGTVHITAVASPDLQYSYATLVVDKEGRSLSNVQPIRFELDTTLLKNGAHSLQVTVSDIAGVLAASKPVSVFITNPTVDNPQMPVTTPPAPTPKPTPAAVAKTPVPTSKPAPSAVATAPTGQHKPATSIVKPAGTATTLEPVLTAANNKPGVLVASANSPMPLTGLTPSLPTRTGQPAAQQIASVPPSPNLTTPRFYKEPAAMDIDEGITPMSVNGTPLPKETVTTVLLDGKPLLYGLAPVTDDGRTMVYLRPLVYATGGDLDWNNSAKQAVISIESDKIIFTLGQSVVSINNASVTLDRPVKQIAGRLIVPATAWRTVFAGSLGYDEDYRYVWLRSHASLVKAGLAR